MNKVYMCTEASHKEQQAISLWHMEEKFGGLTMWKKGCVHTQHGVPTDHLANMDCPKVRHRQPRPRHAVAEDKFIFESEPINPYMGREVRKEFLTAEAHAISWDTHVKLNTQKEKVKISNKKVPKEAAEKRYQKEIRWRQHMDEQIKTLWGQLNNLPNQLANRCGPNIHRRQPTPRRKAWIEEEILR
jgi:hypothetical protein